LVELETDLVEEPPVNTSHRPILRWLSAQLASYLEVPASAISPMVPLAEMGVDSVHAISLVGDVEAYFDIDVDATLIFDYPTLAGIADFISAAVADREQVA
jgi:acyl carrier protein